MRLLRLSGKKAVGSKHVSVLSFPNSFIRLLETNRYNALPRNSGVIMDER